MNRRESLARNLPDDLPESGPRPVPLEEQTDILRPIEERPPGPVETGERKIPASKWKKFDCCSFTYLEKTWSFGKRR